VLVITPTPAGTLAKQQLLVLSPATLATKARVIACKGDMIEYC
jgi:hypothetical protein